MGKLRKAFHKCKKIYNEIQQQLTIRQLTCILKAVGETPTINNDQRNENMNENKSTLSLKILELRQKNKYTQKYVAEYLGIDKSTYAHYEAGRRLPNANKLSKLASLYNLQDELLGSGLPLVVTTTYPVELLDSLEMVLDKYELDLNDDASNKSMFNKLKSALEPIIKIKEETLELPSIDIKNLPEGTTTKIVRLDMRAEKLITRCLKKQNELIKKMYS